MNASQIISIIGALGIGSILGQWLGNAKERRQTRADVLAALSEVETMRWWSATTKNANDFTLAARSLQTACLIARVPRRVVAEYLIWARAAFWTSEEAWNNDPDPEAGGGGIEADFSDQVREAAVILADAVWAPFILRRFIARRLRKLNDPARLAELDKAAGRQLRRSRRSPMALLRRLRSC
jgi:hypothetical protein